jgi:membrane associated rhomboid family serine protease
MQLQFQKTYSNILIAISFFATIISFWFQNFAIFWMHGEFLANHQYWLVVIQFIAYQFLHWGFLHFFSNSIFLYLFWNIVERQMWLTKFNLFFLGNTLFVWVALLFLSQWPTIWISGFAMAILSYYMLELRRIWHPDYKSAMLMLFINIAIGFTGNISFVGHLAGALWWGLFWLASISPKKKY